MISDPALELYDDDDLQVLVEVIRVAVRGGPTALCDRFGELAESDAGRLAEWVEWIRLRAGCRCRTLDLADHLVRGVYLLRRCIGAPD